MEKKKVFEFFFLLSQRKAKIQPRRIKRKLILIYYEMF